jgi:hypothetical protein
MAFPSISVDVLKKDANGETNKMYLFNPNFITDYKGISYQRLIGF